MTTTHDLTAPIVTLGAKTVSITSALMLVPEDEAVAFAGFQTPAPLNDRAWVVARYCHGGLPANRNGHAFPIADLQQNRWTIEHSAFNILHRPQHVVGAYVATNWIEPAPIHQPTANPLKVAEAARDFNEAPYIEALATIWKRRFPEEHQAIVSAHAVGRAWESMECLPEKVSCVTCGHEAAWAGHQSKTYCTHMNRHDGMWLHNPMFLGGAAVIPPARPGWADADITEISTHLDANPEHTDAVLTQVAASNPDLNETEALQLAARLIGHVHPDAKTGKKVWTPGFTPDVAAAALNALDHGGLDAAFQVLAADAPKYHYVGIPVPRHVTDSVAGGIQVPHDQEVVTMDPEQDPHITVALVDATAPAAVFERAVSEWAAETKAFNVTVGTSSTIFENGDERPFVADVVSKDLLAARSDLLARLELAGLTPGGKGARDYHPHMTIRYLGPDDGNPTLDPGVAASFTAFEVTGNVRLPDGTKGTFAHDLTGSEGQ